MTSLYVKIRQFIQPYYVPKPKPKAVPDADEADEAAAVPKGKAGKKKSKKAKKAPAPAAAAAAKAPSPEKSTSREVRVLNYDRPLTKAAGFKRRPSPDTIYCYSDDNVIQVFACFKSGKAGRRYPNRNDNERKKLKPLIYPQQNVPFHRTHLIPIGFHGSEKDARLLVGWDGVQNSGPLKNFEQSVVKNIDHPFYWLTSINKVPGGAEWHYRIYDARNPDTSQPAPLLRGYTLDLELKCPFVWRTKAKSG